MSRKIKVAGLVIEKRGFEREVNMRELEELLSLAAGAGAQIAVTPEGFLEGYIIQEPGLTPERYAKVAEEIPNGRYFKRMCKLARANGLFLASGFAEKSGDLFYNTCALISPAGELIGKYHKSHTLNDEPLNTLGNSFPVFDTEVGKIGIMICYDRQPPEVARLLTLHGAEIILNPAAGSYGETNTHVVRTRAYENGVPIIFAHFAQALIIDHKGDVVKQYDPNGSRAVVAEVEIGRTESTIDFRRPDLYEDLTRTSLRRQDM